MPAFIPTFKYKVIKILLNHLRLTLCNLIVCVCVCVCVFLCVCLCGVIIETEWVFYSKYIDWDGVNKWGCEDRLIRGRINSFWE